MPRHPPTQYILRILGVSALSLLLMAAGGAETPNSVLEDLRAADRARASNAAEAQAWAEEKARLELLLAAAEEQISAARDRKQTAQSNLQQLRASVPETPLAQFDDGALQVARQIDDALDALAKQVPPGVIPPRDSRRADPYQALDQTLHRLERSERATSSIDVTIAPGRLAGEPLSVEVLRFGGVAAWWRSLDGTRGGEAKMVDGRLQLNEAEASAVEAIGRASAIAKGRRAPEIVVLPVKHARTSTGADR